MLTQGGGPERAENEPVDPAEREGQDAFEHNAGNEAAAPGFF